MLIHKLSLVFIYYLQKKLNFLIEMDWNGT